MEMIPCRDGKLMVGSTMITSVKGQLISECPFEVLNFPKNQQSNLTSF